MNASSRDAIRDVAVEELLGRKQAHLGGQRAGESIRGKVVMVTGAAGSIGSELCRQIASFHPAALVGFDHAETPLFYLERELTAKFPALRFHPDVGSVTRFTDLDWVMQQRKPAMVYHAAAYKHVPLMESQPFAAVENNVFGTWNAARAAAVHGAERFVLISSDKAVRPSGVMGATKRLAELAISALQQKTGTRFIAVRFGNVLESSGSVVPIFKAQIAAGGPVTVTHAQMKRYFMTLSEAAQLVMESAALGNGGEIFVLDMGEPVSILNLANNLISLSGLRPGLDIAVEVTGMRPGEKLFEELKPQNQNLVPTPHPLIRSLIGQPPAETDYLATGLLELRQSLESRDPSQLLHLLKTLIPEYCPGGAPASDVIPIDSEAESRFDGLSGRPAMVCMQ